MTSGHDTPPPRHEDSRHAAAGPQERPDPRRRRSLPGTPGSRTRNVVTALRFLALSDDPRAVALTELAPLLDAGETAWQDRALCTQVDPEIFFPEKGGSTREAKRVCQACEVRAECLEYALGIDERHGIWGGMSERERRRLRRPSPGPRMCGNGLHLMDEKNTYVRPDGVKGCRACRLAAGRRRRLERHLARKVAA